MNGAVGTTTDEHPTAPTTPAGSSRLFIIVVMVTSLIAGIWSVTTRLVGWYSFPDAFSRVVGLTLGAVAGILVVAFLITAWVRSRANRLRRGSDA